MTVEKEPSRESSGERLQKVLAAAGVASRRASEILITQGRVRVNGKVVRELGSRVDPAVDEIAVDNKAIQLDSTKRYVLLNKPQGVVSTMSDEQGRRDLREFTERYPERLYNVGRLDAETTGLLLLTNDGEAAQVLSHPSFGVEKTYLAKVRGKITGSALQQLRQGIELEDGFIKADRIRALPETQGGNSLVELSLHSGKNRIVRRMLDAVGFPVLELARLSFGPLRLGSLKLGKTRQLSRAEQSDLLTLVRQSRDIKRFSE